MNNFNTIQHIKDLCTERGWSYYKLAKSSGIAYSTLNTLMNSNNMPTINSLIKICDGFGISLPEFFNSAENSNHLTTEQSECLSLFTDLAPEDKKIAIAFMKGLHRKL